MSRQGQTPERKRRLKWGALPEPVSEASLGWGKQREELKGLTPAQLVRLILDAPEFEAVMGARLDAIDTRNQGKRSRPIRWQARQLESFLLYRRVSGLTTIKRARERLTFDRAGRLLLGFGEELPSQATISRYLDKHFEEIERAAMLQELERQLRLRVTDLESFEDEAAILGMDGSKVEIRYRPPVPGSPEQETKHGKVTAPDAGWVGKTGGSKAGRGYQLVAVWTQHGTPLGWDISPLHHGERAAAERVLDDYAKNVLAKRDPAKLSVLTADGGFNSNQLRRQLQDLRIVPNIHRASHGDKESSIANAKKKTRQRDSLYDPLKPAYANWSANGHGELICACGEGGVERQIRVTNGKLSIASVGRCSNCGSVRITAGRWRRAQNRGEAGVNEWVRTLPGDEGKFYFGNPLTFNDPLAKEYGQDRFGWGESFHSTLASRFGLLRGRAWFRRKTQVETEFAIAFSAIHALTLERARRQEQDDGPASQNGPPSIAAAA
jgi:hypothetical protein